MVDAMAGKPTKAVSFWSGDLERRTVAPWDFERRAWKRGEQVRVVGSQVDSASPTAMVWVEDREQPGLVFRLELDRDGQMVGFGVRPLAFIGEFRPDGTPVGVVGGEVDDQGYVPGAPLLSAALLQRSIKVGRLHQCATAALKRYGRVLPIAQTPVAQGKPQRRVRPSQLSDETLSKLASEYVDLVSSGYGSDVTKRLAKRHTLSEGGVIYRIRTARQRGLLTATTRGRPGGSLTAKAKRLL